VIYEAASLARNRIVLAISSGEIIFVLGCLAYFKNNLICSSNPTPFCFALSTSSAISGGVATHPGHIALHVMPNVAISTATALVNPTSACLDEQ